MKWRESSGIFCDERVLTTLKSRFLNMKILNEMGYWLMDKKTEHRVSFVTMRVLRWTTEVTMVKRIRNLNTRSV